MATEYLIKDTTLSAIADSIREKSGEVGPIKVGDMASKISAIEVGGSSSVETCTVELSYFTGNWANAVTMWYTNANMELATDICEKYCGGGIEGTYIVPKGTMMVIGWVTDDTFTIDTMEGGATMVTGSPCTILYITGDCVIEIY